MTGSGQRRKTEGGGTAKCLEIGKGNVFGDSRCT